MLILPGGLEAPDLPDGPFDVMVADPAWKFRGYSAARGNRDVSRHYDLMTLDQIKALPVPDIMAKDALLFLWTTGPMLDDSLALMRHWGFRYSTVAFVWVKLLRRHNDAQLRLTSRVADEFHLGGGYTTRKNSEMVILGRRGKGLPRQRKDIRELIITPVREHSRKPDELLERVEKYVGRWQRKVELFSRTTRPGWQSWGNQSGKFDVL